MAGAEAATRRAAEWNGRTASPPPRDLRAQVSVDQSRPPPRSGERGRHGVAAPRTEAIRPAVEQARPGEAERLIGMALAPAVDAVLGVLPAGRPGAGIAITMTFRYVSGALGVALLGSLLAEGDADRVNTKGPACPSRRRGPGLHRRRACRCRPPRRRRARCQRESRLPARHAPAALPERKSVSPQTAAPAICVHDSAHRRHTSAQRIICSSPLNWAQSVAHAWHI